ncbi:family 2 encapsulin nanocompartment cargo protein terpene cyclase [Nocardia transvalensis]|uniref:family 2 encapsulin nanocompartment cargo protein terpene cyclase n=1 Tax=Nocardia transvalensis TaxID=37333 RepID=UPI0018956234|nr:family 2 encapsulin nanocompartment cargo protein terpene cyclase [Nocardia transvalensis]MBF6329850.1 hypothetical protein [Nocardia transvalensis]
MSVLSRAAALPATHEVAAEIAALLTTFDHAPPTLPPHEHPPLADMVGGVAPRRLLGPAGLGAASLLLRPPEPPPRSHRIGSGTTGSASAQSSAATRAGSPPPRLPPSPTGIGTAALATRAPIPQGANESGSPPQESESAIPPLHCPPPVRDDPALAAAVNEGIIGWASAIGLYEGRLGELRRADFGRLIMLAHPDCDDADQLLAAAQMAVSEWSVDDYYCEEDAGDLAPDGTPSSAEAELGPRLELAMAAIDPVHLTGRYQLELERALDADPILRAHRTAFDHLAHYATPAQLARLRSEIAGFFLGVGAEAGWRAAGRMPPVWEYLTNRHINSFLPCLALVDAIGGYELTAAEYVDPRVRRVVTNAALAAQIVNDLYSLAKEDLSDGREFNLPTVLEAEEQCSRREAVRRTAAVHDELMYRIEREAAALTAVGSPELGRFLRGVWNWTGGSRAWHAGSRRYHEKD